MLPEDQGQPLIRMPVALPWTLHEWLREASHQRRVSMAQLIREAVQQYRVQIDPQMDLPMGSDQTDV